ncbi:hypothetical protein D3C77_672300 [compost metagenome]
MPITVMAAELRLVLVGQKPCGHQRPTGQRAVGIDTCLGPACAVMARPLLQRQVEAIQIGAVEAGRLVGDFVGFGVLVQVHRGLLADPDVTPVNHAPPPGQSDKNA